jgi:hypothetical protein
LVIGGRFDASVTRSPSAALATSSSSGTLTLLPPVRFSRIWLSVRSSTSNCSADVP